MPIAAVAADASYFDHAHFGHEFKACWASRQRSTPDGATAPHRRTVQQPGLKPEARPLTVGRASQDPKPYTRGPATRRQAADRARRAAVPGHRRHRRPQAFGGGLGVMMRVSLEFAWGADV